MDMVASFHCSTQHGVFNVHAGATNFYSNIHTVEALAGLCWQVVLPLRKCRCIIHVRYFSSLQTPHPSFSFLFFFNFFNCHSWLVLYSSFPLQANTQKSKTISAFTCMGGYGFIHTCFTHAKDTELHKRFEVQFALAASLNLQYAITVRIEQEEIQMLPHSMGMLLLSAGHRCAAEHKVPIRNPWRPVDWQ